MRPIKKSLIVVSAVIAVCCILAIPFFVLPSLAPANQPTPTPQGNTIQEGVNNAIRFLEGRTEPDALLMLDVLHRRFAIAEFVGCLARYDQILAENPEHAPLLRVFRRILSHNNTLQAGDMQSIIEDFDRVTVPALYCDQIALADDYSEMLTRALNMGAYYVTHVLLASIWMKENGCQVPISIQNVYQAAAALINKDINTDPVVTDLKLEAAAFLYVAGQGSLVSDKFIQRVVATQNFDGGWKLSSDVSGGSYWHSTVLGLMLLLHLERPASTYPPMLSPT